MSRTIGCMSESRRKGAPRRRSWASRLKTTERRPRTCALGLIPRKRLLRRVDSNNFAPPCGSHMVLASSSALTAVLAIRQDGHDGKRRNGSEMYGSTWVSRDLFGGLRRARRAQRLRRAASKPAAPADRAPGKAREADRGGFHRAQLRDLPAQRSELLFAGKY